MAHMNSLALLERQPVPVLPGFTFNHVQDPNSLQNLQHVQAVQQLDGVQSSLGINSAHTGHGLTSAQNMVMVPTAMTSVQVPFNIFGHTNAAATNTAVGAMDASGRFNNLFALTPTNGQAPGTSNNVVGQHQHAG